MKKGDFVRVNYIGRLESGEIFDLTDEDVAKKEKLYSEKIRYKPLPVIVGAGFLISGLDKALLDMNPGDKKTIEISPEDGFGQRDPRLVKVVPQKAFEGKIEPRAGLVVDFSGMKGRIQSASAGRITVDFNNPLAGKNLKYDIEIKDEIKEKGEKVRAVLEYFGAENPEIIFEGKEVSVKMKLPDEIKERASALILEHIEGIEAVNYIETFAKKGSMQAE